MKFLHKEMTFDIFFSYVDAHENHKLSKHIASEIKLNSRSAHLLDQRPTNHGKKTMKLQKKNSTDFSCLARKLM